MKGNERHSIVPVFRPSVVAVIVYAGLCSIWFIWLLCTWRYPTASEAGPPRIISGTQYAAVSSANVALLAALVFDGLRSRRSPPGLRRAHYLGLALAAILLVLVQVGVFWGHRPVATG